MVHHIAESSNVVMNVRTDYIVTSRDKIELALRRKLPLFLRKTAWVAPLSLLTALVMSIITSDFTDFMGVDKEVWSTLFIMGALLAGLWLVRNTVLFFRSTDLDGVLEAVVATHDVEDRSPLRGEFTHE